MFLTEPRLSYTLYVGQEIVMSENYQLFNTVFTTDPWVKLAQPTETIFLTSMLLIKGSTTVAREVGYSHK